MSFAKLLHGHTPWRAVGGLSMYTTCRFRPMVHSGMPRRAMRGRSLCSSLAKWHSDHQAASDGGSSRMDRGGSRKGGSSRNGGSSRMDRGGSRNSGGSRKGGSSRMDRGGSRMDRGGSRMDRGGSRMDRGGSRMDAMSKAVYGSGRCSRVVRPKSMVQPSPVPSSTGGGRRSA